MNFQQCPHCGRAHSFVSHFCSTNGTKLPNPPFREDSELARKMREALCHPGHERLIGILKQHNAFKGSHYCEYCGEKISKK